MVNGLLPRLDLLLIRTELGMHHWRHRPRTTASRHADESAIWVCMNVHGDRCGERVDQGARRSHWLAYYLSALHGVTARHSSTRWQPAVDRRDILELIGRLKISPDSHELL